MTTATCLPSRIALVNGHIRPLVCTKWVLEPESMYTRILYRGEVFMSEGKCGKGKGEIGVREGKEGGREVSGRERRKREGRHRR